MTISQKGIGCGGNGDAEEDERCWQVSTKVVSYKRRVLPDTDATYILMRPTALHIAQALWKETNSLDGRRAGLLTKNAAHDL